MRRTFKNHHFVRWMRKTELNDSILCEAVAEMVSGLIDADLGGGVVKKRVPLPGRGKSGSTRTLLATNKGDRWFFVLGFEKNERENIGTKELIALRLLADDYLGQSDKNLDALISSGTMQEICHENKKNSA